MPTIEEALAYLGIDYQDAVTATNVTRALATACKTVRGAVGDDVDVLMPDDPRVKELALIYLDDLYSNRGLSAKVSNATRLSVQTLELQLVTELRILRARKEVSSV